MKSMQNLQTKPTKPNQTYQTKPNLHFWSFGTKYWPFWSIWCHARPKNNANEVPYWFFDIWVPELLLPPKIIRMFSPKTAISPPIMHTYVQISLAGSFGVLLVGCCGARAVSRKSQPIYFMFFHSFLFSLKTCEDLGWLCADLGGRRTGAVICNSHLRKGWEEPDTWENIAPLSINTFISLQQATGKP